MPNSSPHDLSATTVTPSELLERIAAGESQTLEFKTSFDKASIESLVAFANTQGGTVLVGVTDAARVQGVTVGKETLNEWLGQIKSATSPSLIPDLVAHPLNGKTVVSIQVAEFPVKPVSTRGRYYKRIASSNHALALNEIADLYLQSLQISWDAHPAPQASLADLSSAKIERFIQRVNDNGRFALEASAPLAALEKLNYLVKGQPTWAAMLLFAREPLRHHIHIGRFKTPSMIIDDRQFTDTLFEVVEQSMTFIVSHISVAFEFDGSIQRKERFAYPLPALREALLNAVVHRSYTDPSDIQIKIFDDQITIFSPGTFYGGISIADIQADNYRSSLRNKLVAEGFYLTNAIEKYGSGFIRIRKALQDYPEIDFEIKEFAGGVMVTFAQKQSESPREGVSGGVSGGVSPESAHLLHLIQSQPGLKTTELVAQTAKPQRTVERWLKQLKDRQLIEFRGAPKTGGYYPKDA
ncbi:MAG: putative DNA binding domain-containing protein [Burkholderiaceae bacterium]|nr:putative DNA binding domain-containing protein [Burkholderiaceae bacterium]